LNGSQLPPLTPALIARLAAQFDASPKYQAVERSLTWLFETKPANTDVSDVLLKVVTENSLYSTQVFARYELARHIKKVGLDVLLADGSMDAVEAVAHVRPSHLPLARTAPRGASIAASR
jgi:hypothetical protein